MLSPVTLQGQRAQPATLGHEAAFSNYGRRDCEVGKTNGAYKMRDKGPNNINSK